MTPGASGAPGRRGRGSGARPARAGQLREAARLGLRSGTALRRDRLGHANARDLGACAALAGHALPAVWASAGRRQRRAAARRRGGIDDLAMPWPRSSRRAMRRRRAARPCTEGGLIRTATTRSSTRSCAVARRQGLTWPGLEAGERERTGIGTLKVGYNKVFGYYIEVTKAPRPDACPDDYMRKQTLVNAERFITAELKEYEAKVARRRGARARRWSTTLFAQLRDRVRARRAHAAAGGGALAGRARLPAAPWPRWPTSTATAAPHRRRPATCCASATAATRWSSS